MRAAGAAVLVAALGSAAVGYGRTWRLLDDQLRLYGALTPAAAAHAAGTSIPLPADVFDFYNAHLRPREHFYLLVKTPPHAIDRPLIVRSYAWFWLGPAIQLASPTGADVVLGYKARPQELPFRPARVVTMPGKPGFFVAWRRA